MEKSYKTGNINQRVLYIKSLLITSSSKVVISGMVSIFFLSQNHRNFQTSQQHEDNKVTRPIGKADLGVEVWYQKPYPLDFEARESKHGGMQSWR